MPADFWTKADQALAISKRYRLSEEERKLVANAEQVAYEANLEKISLILEEYRKGLSERGFWTECLPRKEGMRFRYSMPGFYGPGGFSSQFHIAGPLVLAEINPKGDAVQSFYSNDLDQNVKIGADFEPESFRAFIEKNVQQYLAPENLIVTREQYERIRALYPGK
jgi:hypothetical protein